MVSEALGSLTLGLPFPHSLPCSPPASFQLIQPAAVPPEGPLHRQEALCLLLERCSLVNHSPSCRFEPKYHFLWEAFWDSIPPTCCCMHGSSLSHMWSW